MAEKPIHPTVPGTWPNAEPESVRAAEALELAAQRRAELEKLNSWTRMDVEFLAKALRVANDRSQDAHHRVGYLISAVERTLHAFGLDEDGTL